VADPPASAAWAWQLDGEKIDVALYVAGVCRTAAPPSRRRARSSTSVMRTNVLGAMQAIPQVAPLVEAPAAAVRVHQQRHGPDRRRGIQLRWVYRASKAALNMAVASAQPTTRRPSWSP
jgi:NAD(P)-dependent dehydrogenase (short-subunit alcohol dehydrogenase family)